MQPERGVLYENAVSQLYGEGWQYYLNIKMESKPVVSMLGKVSIKAGIRVKHLRIGMRK